MTEYVFGEYKYIVNNKVQDDILLYKNEEVAMDIIMYYPEYTRKFRGILRMFITQKTSIVNNSHSVNSQKEQVTRYWQYKNKINKLIEELRNEILYMNYISIRQINISNWIKEFNHTLHFLEEIYNKI